MIDSPEHVKIMDSTINSAINSGEVPSFSKRLKVCIDVDMSFRPLNSVHLGVFRSPIHSTQDFMKVVEAVQASNFLLFSSVMGYEAQITVWDNNSPAGFLKDKAVSLMKRLSVPDVMRKRKEISEILKQKHIPCEFFNGGGSATLSSTINDSTVTEITIGSGILQSHTFDYQKTLYAKPAFFFALCVTRIPARGMATCQSGGFIASGSLSEASNPLVILPSDATPTENEGFGEVQTPLHSPTHTLAIGDPVFCRPTKAGEIAERFNEYYVIEGKSGSKTRKNEVWKTYRGFGHCFF